MMVVYATTPDDDDGVTLARNWIKAQCLTGDDVRMVKREGCVMVLDKGDAHKRLKVTDGNG